MKKIIIAIDGYSSCGKSTLAKALAAKLGYGYVDSGAMYRAVTLYFLQNNIDLNSTVDVLEALEKISIRFASNKKGNRTILNGEDVEAEIRKMPVSNMVSQVSAISEVRRAMVRQQQQMGLEKGIVMDGRDIGTVVFPDAELKIFLTAEVEERARRRFKEMQNKGLSTTMEEVKKNLAKRDRIDSSREDSPLRQAPDAILIDNTNMTQEKQLALSLELVNEKTREFS